MLAYIIRRLFQAIVVLIGVSIISFFIMFLTGDPVSAMVSDDWTHEMIEDLREGMGFNRPLHIQYLDFLSKAVRGDLGVSIRQHQPNITLIMNRMPATVELAGAALLFSLLISIPIGILSALKRGSWQDNIIMVVALLGQSTPVFWLGIMLMLIFSVHFRLTPVSGRDGWESLILPAITLGAFSTARNARMMRSTMIEVLSQDYIRTARSKGLKESAILYIHALRNALIPVVTLVGLQLGMLLGGAVITEQIFAWPGVGRLIVNAIYGKDIPLVQASIMVIAAIFVFINLMVDILYTVLDPRIRLK